MDKALHDPQFALKPEYRLSETEKAAYLREQFKDAYHSSLSQIPNLPVETMSRLVNKALHGEPLTIVLSEQADGIAKKQQQTILEQLEGFLGVIGIPYEVISDRHTLKKKLEKELGSSNIFAIGNANTNRVIRALKPGIIQKSKAIGFDWKTKMNQKASSGAYIIKHPYNQNRLLLHLFWNDKAMSGNAVEPFAEQMISALGFSDDFYQYYILDKAGHIASGKKTANPLAKFFTE